jgi:outer membrane lipoprotein SlyB
MRKPAIACVTVACLALQACSSRPREFRPTFAATPASQAEVDTAYSTCQQLFVAGKLDSNGQVGSAGAGAAVGVGTAAAGGAAAAAAGPWAGAAVASATVVLLPFAILGGAWGMSRMKRANKERAIKRVMSGCMAQRGYPVAGWTKTGRKVIPAKS